MSDDDTTLGDDIREYRRPHAVLAARADALTAALREARAEVERLRSALDLTRAERDHWYSRVDQAEERSRKADAEVERLRHINVDLTNAGMDETERADRLAAQVEKARALAHSYRVYALNAFEGDGKPAGMTEAMVAEKFLAALDAGREGKS